MYTATYTFKIKAVKGSHVQGWAAPKSGPRCSCLLFYAGDTLVAAARADKHDSDAAKQGLRHGWCKFEIRLTPRHFVLAETLRVCCSESGMELGQISRSEVAFDDSGVVGLNSVEAIAKVNLDDRYTDIRPFEPLIMRLSELLDDEQFVSFAYRFVLERRSDVAGVASYRTLAKSSPTTIIQSLLESEEFKRKRDPGLPGPFSHEFPVLPVFE